MSTMPSGSTRVTLTFLYSFPSIALKSSASATDAQHRIINVKIIIWSCIAILGGSSATAAGPQVTGWIQLCPPISPPPRSYLAMTYDPASGKVIMFGGFDGTTYLNDTWTFDGITWAQVATLPSPPARTNAQIAYDAVTQKVVLFGGFNGRNYLGDTWLWDGTASRWAQV